MNPAKSLITGLAACLLAVALPTLAAAPAPATGDSLSSAGPGGQVIYSIFVRSFRDSNGDRIGDLDGIRSKLGYIKQLGATTILLSPVAPSPFYHNYFATAFKAIDPAYGTMADHFKLVRAAHAHGLKVYKDEEFQYVAQGNPWWADSICKPQAKYADYLLWKGPKHCVAEPFLNKAKWMGYDGKSYGIAMVNLENPAVQKYFTQLLLYWADPSGNCNGPDRAGVDGFRIDHMMANLDHKDLEKHLLTTFWAPLIHALKACRPHLDIFAEQASWGNGITQLRKAHADMVYAYPLYRALISLNKPKIVKAIKAEQASTPPGKQKVIFLEDHDVERFMSVVHGNMAKARAGAAIQLTLKGVPMIYYGQELGMRGRMITTGAVTDGMGIPVREAFRWKTSLKAPGSAIWYRGDQPWWTYRYNRTGDGTSLQAERGEPHSLYHWYRKLLALRHARPELHAGSQRVLCKSGKSPVLCILRQDGKRKTLLLVNLGMNAARPHLGKKLVDSTSWVNLLKGAAAGPLNASLKPMQVRIVGTPWTDGHEKAVVQSIP